MMTDNAILFNKEDSEVGQVAIRCQEHFEQVMRKYREGNNKKRKDAEKRLRELENASGPALEAVNHKVAYQAKIEAFLERQKEALKNAEASADSASRAVEAQEERRRDVDNKHIAEGASFKTRREKIGAMLESTFRYAGPYKEAVHTAELLNTKDVVA